MSWPVKNLAMMMLILALAAWVWLEHARKSVAATGDPVISAREASKPASANQDDLCLMPAPVSAVPEVALNTNSPTEGNSLPEDSGVAVPATESSWAKELRELKELAARDPAAALERVARMSEKEERMSALKELCLQVATNDPPGAMNAAWHLGLGQLTDNPAEEAALENLAQRWAATDLPGALTWVSELPEDEDGRRDRALQGMAVALAQTAPAEAAGLVAEGITPGSRMQFNAAMVILRQWAVRDYAGASGWVDLFPEGSMRDRGREELVRSKPSQQSPENRSN
jgi:hypothetical protein